MSLFGFDDLMVLGGVVDGFDSLYSTAIVQSENVCEDFSHKNKMAVTN